MFLKSGVLLMLVVLTDCQSTNTVAPNVTVVLRPLRPKGFRAFITADAEYGEFLLFDGILYENMEKAVNSAQDVGLLWGPAIRETENRWLFENKYVHLTVGMGMRYGVFIPDQLPTGNNENGRATLMFNGSMPDYKLFKVTALEDPLAPPPYCVPTVTKVRGRQVCSGDVIFEDDFETLREDQWQIEHYIPADHPENPFVSYQRLTSDQNVFVQNSQLHIVPKLQDELMTGDQSIETGTLDLTIGCTRRMCSKAAFGSNIIPPIVSARVTNVPFAFTYGIVYIKAKIPQGEWLYPEFLVEPLFKTYVGEKDFATVLKVAKISEIISSIQDFRGRSGVIQTCSPIHDFNRSLYDEFRSEGFHEYELKWTPVEIELFVDGMRYMHADVWRMEQCFKHALSGFVPNYSDYRHLSLGVAVGGTMFPDFITTDAGHVKPWRNGDSKASLKFWRNKHQWYPTWTAPSLVIEHIKVTAL